MKKSPLVFVYSLFCYVIFLATFLYAIGFVTNLFVPRAIDGPQQTSLSAGLIIDALLLTVFALQHSIMARPAFKRWWTKIVPETAERSTYVLASSLALILVFAFWQPLGGIIWSVTNREWAMILNVIGALGWITVLASTLLIDHFDLFGVRQGWFARSGRPYEAIGFRTPAFYRVVRHPLYVGFLLAFWATPTMTVTHLLFALLTSGYIFVAVQFEEHDLEASLGSAYKDYRERVPMFVPLLKSFRRARPGSMRTVGH
jgi:protein-S-isoprenylcysteine O-methyltransferase Ste14